MNIKKIIAGLSIALLVPMTASGAFTDLTEDHPNYEAIQALNAEGCLGGYEDGTMRPDNSITRAETLKLMLWCLDLPGIFAEETFTVPAGGSYSIDGTETEVESDTSVTLKTPFDPVNYPALEFTDIIQEAWYINTLKTALVRGLITGYSDNTIKPLNTVTRGEFFTILFRLVPTDIQNELELEEEIAADVFEGQWYDKGLAFALEKELVAKDEDENLLPFKELTRGEVAQHIHDYDEWITARLNPPEAAAEEDTGVSETEVASETTLNEEQFEVGQTEIGVASYYGPALNGNNTASGQIFDDSQLTAAHKTLPFGTIVRVTNPEDGKWVEVNITDRGPFVEGRIIDLTSAAFEVIASLSRGVIHVSLEVISLPE